MPYYEKTSIIHLKSAKHQFIKRIFLSNLLLRNEINIYENKQHHLMTFTLFLKC
jgi:hypothetical protein